jgi:hypothetical protein
MNEKSKWLSNKTLTIMLRYERKVLENGENFIMRSFFCCEENQMKDFDVSYSWSRFIRNSVKSHHMPEEPSGKLTTLPLQLLLFMLPQLLLRQSAPI